MKDAIIGALKSYAVKAMTGLAGWRLALANFLLKYVINAASDAYDWASVKVKSWIAYEKIEKQHEADKKNAEEYKDALEHGSPTDIDNATDDLLNRHK